MMHRQKITLEVQLTGCPQKSAENVSLRQCGHQHQQSTLWLNPFSKYFVITKTKPSIASTLSEMHWQHIYIRSQPLNEPCTHIIVPYIHSIYALECTVCNHFQLKWMPFSVWKIELYAGMETDHDQFCKIKFRFLVEKMQIEFSKKPLLRIQSQQTPKRNNPLHVFSKRCTLIRTYFIWCMQCCPNVNGYVYEQNGISMYAMHEIQCIAANIMEIPKATANRNKKRERRIHALT